MLPRQMKFRALLALLVLPPLALLSAPAQAEDQPPRRIMVGGGLQSVPTYPGANSSKAAFLPVIEIWREGEAIPVETPDESIGFALIGKRGATAIGPALGFAPQRAAIDLPGLPAVKFGVEFGLFAETYLARPLRLRAELRHGIGAHRSLTGELAADLVVRSGLEGPVATIGPRLRWGSTGYNRAYFGVPALSASPALAAYQPESGIYAVGGVAGLHLPLGRSWGVFGQAGYDRLAGAAARSPIVTAGRRDQISAGLALTYRFST